MAIWNWDRLQQSIDKKDFKSFYILFGEEDFLQEEYLNLLKENILGDALPDFNLDVFYPGSDFKINKLIDAIETLPMMAERRLVILKHAQEIKAQDLENLIPILSKEHESTCFILTCSKLDKRQKFFKFADEMAVMVQFDKVANKDMAYWVKKLCSRQGKSIHADAVDLFSIMMGNSLSELNLQIDKVCNYIGEKKQILIEDVKACVSFSKVESIFDLTKAIGQGDRSRALYLLNNLIQNGENEVAILALISRHFRILNHVKEAVNNGLNASQIASQVGLPPFFVKDYLSQAKDWTTEQLQMIYQALLLTDKALKSSPISSQIWLENFVIKTCSQS